MLANGQRTDTQQWGDEHSPNIETSDAERIEVIKGPASVLYGSDAVGGVVNVIPPAIPDAIGVPAAASGKILGAYGTNNINPDGAIMAQVASGGFGVRGALVGRSGDNIRTPVGALEQHRLLHGGRQRSAPGYKAGWGSLQASYVHRYETAAADGRRSGGHAVPARHRQPLQCRARGPDRRQLPHRGECRLRQQPAAGIRGGG